MDLSDQPPPRRPLFFPVVIATVFLSIIGMSAGLVLGARARQDARNATPTTPTPTTPAADGPTTDLWTPTAEAPSPGAPCRPETQVQGRRAGADGVLRTVLHLRTTQATVWICADADDRLYYHANRGGEDAEWVDGRTALFLPHVVASGDGYQARSTDAEGRATVFDVTRQQLTIRHPGGRTEVQRVRVVVSG